MQRPGLTMTKLMQWIAGLVVFLAMYIPILTKMWIVPALEPFEREVKLLPFILIGLFGVSAGGRVAARFQVLILIILHPQIHSLNTVLFRAATIRDCPEAEQELQKEILEAREDLVKRGFKFRECN